MRAGRVPPARPFDAEAAAAAGGGELAAWVAGCTGAVPPRVVVRAVVAGGDGGPAERLAPAGVIRLAAGGALPTVGHVAAAVDAGRALAAEAARDGVTVLIACGAGDDAAAKRVAAWLEDRAAYPAIRGPLGALWRLGSDDLARLCGVALGAGEAGLALVCDGPASTAAARLAVAVQPALAPRVREGVGILSSSAAAAVGPPRRPAA
jgi:nicotinate-nucleotide--dimethylbenzimidazole phosphoribosyltransferase